jgi:hypothetical protein
MITFYPSSIGTTTVTLKLENNGGNALGGSDSTLIKFNVIVLNNAAIDDNTNAGIEIYPNPASEVLFVNLPDELKSSCRISIYNILGTKVGEYTNLDVINIQSLPIGNYLIVISNEKGFEYKSLINIQR